MKKSVFWIILFIIIIGVAGALTLSPEFCYFWQRTPVLKDIYAWVDQYFKPFILTVTKGELRDIYLAIIGSILITIFTFGLLRVKKVKPGSEKVIDVTATLVINNEGTTPVVVVEEN